MRYQHATDTDKYNILSMKGKQGAVRGYSTTPEVEQLMLHPNDDFVIMENDDFIVID